MGKSADIQKVLQLVNEYLPEPLTEQGLEDSLTDRGLDSYGFVELVVALEQEYQFCWPIDEMCMLATDTIGDILQIIEQETEQIVPSADEQLE